MKKIYVLLSLCLIIPMSLTVNASNEDDYKEVLNTYKQYFRGMLPYYQKLYDCTSYSISMDKEMKYQILGKENGKCHVKMGSYNCYFPMDVAKQYSTMGDKYTRKKIDDITSKQELYMSTDEKESQYMDGLQNQYCKIE
mgnify:CR=1 FL=1